MLESLVVRTWAILGMLFAAGNQQVELSQPVVQLRHERIAVSCVLRRPFSEDLLNIIDSGTPVELTFICRLRKSDGTPAYAPDTTIVHHVVKDLAAGTYEVALGSRTLIASVFTEYSQFFRLETVPLWSVKQAASDEAFWVEVSAKLEPIRVQATGQQYDLMAFWNYRAPSARSSVFTRHMLDKRQVGP